MRYVNLCFIYIVSVKYKYGNGKKDMAEEITVYIPDNSVKKGYISLFKEMAEEVRTSKWLMWQLFKRDFKVVYQQSVLGIFWILIPHMVTS